MQRREFIRGLSTTALAGVTGLAAAPGSPAPRTGPRIMTVHGPLPADQLGPALTHEHVLVDFVGAAEIGPSRYDPDVAFRAALPHLRAARDQGYAALFECTPAFIGRDPLLLRRLSRETGMHLITNTGLYGAAKDRFVPAYAYEESAEQLAARWIREAREGIGDTGVFPGFIKIGVDNDDPLSAIDRKLVAAAGIAHRATGLAVAVHTGRGPGLEVLDVLEAAGATPSAFIWVHAQNAPMDAMRKAARRGAWISLDGLREGSADNHLRRCRALKEQDTFGRLLLSHDAGWYDVVNPERPFRGYTFLVEAFVPALIRDGFAEEEIRKVLEAHPARAFGV